MEHPPAPEASAAPVPPLPTRPAPTPPDTSLPVAKVEEITRTWLSLGRNTKATARALKMSRQTVTKYVRHGDPARGIPPAILTSPGSGSSGEVPEEGGEEEGADPPAPAPRPAPPPPRPAAAPSVAVPPPARTDPLPAPLAAPAGLPGASAAPPLPAPSGGPRPALGTREEAEAGMLQFARLQRQLATARIHETAEILRRVKVGVRDPITGKVMKGRISQEDREVLALLRDGARASPLELLKLYEMEERLLARLSPGTAPAGDEDASLEELQREVVALTSGTVNRPEGK